MRRRLGLFALFSLLWSGSAFASELYGVVWYQGKPLQNAEISVKDQKIMTNAKGYYSVQLEPDTYTLQIKLPDGKVKDESVKVFPQSTEKNLKLE